MFLKTSIKQPENEIRKPILKCQENKNTEECLQKFNSFLKKRFGYLF